MAETALAHTWEAVLEQVRAQVPEAQFRTWFLPIRPGRVEDGVLNLRVPNELFREWLGREYSTVIQAAATAVTGKHSQVRLKVDATLPVPQDGAAGAQLVAFDGEPRLNRNYTFGNFVVGPSNRLAYAGSVAAASAPGKVYNPLYIHSGPGLGKSHLLQAICHKLVADGDGGTVIYAPCEAFINQFISALDRGRLDAFRRQCRKADVLVIDDIQLLSRAGRSQEEFFHAFNALHNAQRQIVIASDGEPDQMRDVQARLISRFKSGLVARIDPPTPETRIAIVQHKAAVLGAQLPADVVEYIAESRAASVRELEGAVVRLIGYASLANRTVDKELARAALGTVGARPITMRQIIDSVSNFFGVEAADLQSERRNRSLAHPRHICMFLAREMTQLSLEDIGESFGGRDHTTVLYATTKIKDMTKKNQSLRQTVTKLRHQIERMAEVRGG
jgi:chromosomal replication initiator protein